MSDYCVGIFKEEVIKANNEAEATQEFMKGLSNDDCYAIKLVDRDTLYGIKSYARRLQNSELGKKECLEGLIEFIESIENERREINVETSNSL